MNLFPAFCWSDGWWIEDNMAWFITGNTNHLLQYNYDTNECTVLSQIPQEKGLRWNPECIKIDKKIICLPDRGDRIWIYSLDKKEWENIKIYDNNKGRKKCQFIYGSKKSIVFISRGIGKLFVMDINSYKLDIYSIYDLYENYTKNKFIALSNSVIMNEKIYIAFSESNSILIIDIHKKIYLIKELPIDIKVIRIQADDGKLWIIGLDKAIYLWNESENQIKKFSDFSNTFGGYITNAKGEKEISFSAKVFTQSLFGIPIVSNSYIWLIPWYGTEIIYIDKETYELYKYEIESENATNEDLQYFGCKYLINYVRDNRYLGIFSGKSGCEIEIDMEEKKHRYIEMFLSRKGLSQISPIEEKFTGVLDYYVKNITIKTF